LTHDSVLQRSSLFTNTTIGNERHVLRGNYAYTLENTEQVNIGL